MIRFTLPTMLTLLRVALIPVMVACFYLPWQWAGLLAWFVFAIASITDWLDGYLARKYQESSQFGAFLDPIADKLLVAASLLLVVQGENSIYVTIPAIIIVSRELIISGLREWMALSGAHDVVKVSALGKWKTGMQIVAIGGLLLLQSLQWIFIEVVSYTSLYIATILTLVSMLQYLSAAFKSLQKNGSEHE